MTPDEHRRIREGPRPGEKEPAVTYDVVARCADPEQVLSRVREVLLAVPPLDDGASDEEHPPWRARLPAWFDAEFRPPRTPAEAEADLAVFRAMTPPERAVAERTERWDFQAWVHWFEPANRYWWWWDATTAPGEVRVVIGSDDHPSGEGTLIYLLYRAGASDVERVP